MWSPVTTLINGAIPKSHTSRNNFKFKNMTKTFVRHKISDFAIWKPLYDEHDAVRKEFGCTKSEVFTNYSDPNEVLVILEWESKDHAMKFLQTSNVKEIMERGGVISEPVIEFA